MTYEQAFEEEIQKAAQAIGWALHDCGEQINEAAWRFLVRSLRAT